MRLGLKRAALLVPGGVIVAAVAAIWLLPRPRAARQGPVAAPGPPRFVSGPTGGAREHSAPPILAPTVDVSPASSWPRIEEHLRIATGVGPGARKAYVRSLAELREDARAVSAEIVARYDQISGPSTGLRFALLFLLGELDQPEGEGLLTRVASTPGVPPAPEHHEVPDPDQQLRLVAIRGLGRRLGTGSEAARSALFALVRHPDRSTRLAAARTLVDGFPGDTEVVDALAALLPPSERFVIDGTEGARR
jgi:hypothetical protein